MHGARTTRKNSQGQHHVRCTLAFWLDAVRLIKAGQETSVTAWALDRPKQTLRNWRRLAAIKPL